jgi:hypothetical protein
MTGTLLYPAAVKIDSGDSFWIENHHPTKSLTFQWAKIKYVIAKGKKRIVPFDVIALYFGDPRSVKGAAVPFTDSRGHGTVPERMGEVRRLAVRYGVYEQGMEDIALAIEAENLRLEQLRQDPRRVTPVKDLIDDNFHAKITDLEGNPIITPLFDPEGTYAHGFDQDEGRSDDIATIIARMQAQIDRLRADKEIVDDEGDNVDDGVPIDNPPEAVTV